MLIPEYGINSRSIQKSLDLSKVGNEYTSTTEKLLSDVRQEDFLEFCRIFHLSFVP